MEPVEVYRGKHREPTDLFGPLPGYRDGEALAYEFQLPTSFEPWPGRSRIERTFVLLDFGISFANPCWWRWHKPDGTIGTSEPEGRDSWYVDLVSIERSGNTYTILDLYIDVVVTTDDRGYRVLDLDEYADAMATGALGLEEGLDGLRRWQTFLDEHLHDNAWESSGWPDFPPERIRGLRELGQPLGDVVTFHG